MEKTTIVPFVKWVGGKRQLIEELVKYIPNEYDTYHEPFIGGGALLFYLKPKKAYISDLNSELVNTFKVVRNSYKRLREYLLIMEYGHSEIFYKKIREIDKNDDKNKRMLNLKDSSVLRAARFIYLNKSSFNGIYRVNSNGYFNVPSGKKRKVKTFEYKNLEKISLYLKENDIDISVGSFSKVTKNVQPGDFVYFDPPYDYEVDQVGFDQYQKGSFGGQGQFKLALICKALDKVGVKWMTSNHNTVLINKLYKGFNIRVVKAKRLVGGKGASRSNVEEVIITNYAK